jgi:hypothetical protein
MIFCRMIFGRMKFRRTFGRKYGRIIFRRRIFGRIMFSRMIFGRMIFGRKIFGGMIFGRIICDGVIFCRTIIGRFSVLLKNGDTVFIEL